MALLCGIILAVVNFIKMMLINRATMLVTAVVSITLICTVLCAKSIGCIYFGFATYLLGL